MKLISYKQKWGNPERICTQRDPHRVLLSFKGKQNWKISPLPLHPFFMDQDSSSSPHGKTDRVQACSAHHTTGQ